MASSAAGMHMVRWASRLPAGLARFSAASVSKNAPKPIWDVHKARGHRYMMSGKVDVAAYDGGFWIRCIMHCDIIFIADWARELRVSTRGRSLGEVRFC
jgi:hypothetical protein